MDGGAFWQKKLTAKSRQLFYQQGSTIDARLGSKYVSETRNRDTKEKYDWLKSQEFRKLQNVNYAKNIKFVK